MTELETGPMGSLNLLVKKVYRRLQSLSSASADLLLTESSGAYIIKNEIMSLIIATDRNNIQKHCTASYQGGTT